MRQSVACALIALTMLSTSLVADGTEHAVDPGVLANAVVRHADEQDANRAAIHAALARPEVQSVAETMGLDVDHANALVDTLSGQSLDQAAAAARQVNQSLAGGAQSITFSATTIIIALLVIILIIVAVH